MVNNCINCIYDYHTVRHSPCSPEISTVRKNKDIFTGSLLSLTITCKTLLTIKDSRKRRRKRNGVILKYCILLVWRQWNTYIITTSLNTGQKQIKKKLSAETMKLGELEYIRRSLSLNGCHSFVFRKCLFDWRPEGPVSWFKFPVVPLVSECQCQGRAIILAKSTFLHMVPTSSPQPFSNSKLRLRNRRKVK
jgi:hypothetical protein